MEDQEVMEAMRAVDDAMGSGGAESAAAGGAEAISIPNPCDAYNKIRNVLPTLIKIAERIPVVGKRLAAALQLLKTIGDQFCPRTESAGGAAG